MGDEKKTSVSFPSVRHDPVPHPNTDEFLAVYDEAVRALYRKMEEDIVRRIYTSNLTLSDFEIKTSSEEPTRYELHMHGQIVGVYRLSFKVDVGKEEK